MRHALFLTLLLTALLGDAMPAWAAEEKAASDKAANAKDWAFPKADAKDTWREVRQDSSTSICISSMATPLCVLDTVIACMARGGEVCFKALDDPKSANHFATRKRHPNTFYRYRYLGASAVEQDGQGGFPERRKRDAIVYFIYWYCDLLDAGAVSCSKPFSGPPMELTLRRKGTSWQSLGWSAPNPR